MTSKYCFEPIADAELGLIEPYANARAARFIFRPTEQGLRATCPACSTRRQLLEAIERIRPSLLRLKQKARANQSAPLAAGSEFEMTFFTLRIAEHAHPTRFTTQYADGVLTLLCPAGSDYADASVTATIEDLLNTVVRRAAPAQLVRHARSIANALGLNPRNFRVSYGKQRLGRCDTHGEILLSYRLMYYPRRLVDFVIKHELAHLTEMNHGPRFYALLDRYTGGNLARLERELKEFRCPVS